ncbi:MAG: hypothetical protein FWH11_07950 [Micrococcales bacterium]|nr:hypothetical protein [Micrococcales bacterium]
MDESWVRVDPRTVVTVIALDAVTYVLVYWLMFRAFEPTLESLEPMVAQGVLHVVAAVRLTAVGLFATRSFRRRLGMETRVGPLLSVGVGAAITLTLGIVLGIASRSMMGVAGPSVVESAIGVVEGLVFPLLGLLFVIPGEAEEPLFSRH